MEFVKIFNFLDKKPSFLEIIHICLNLGIRFCITWLVLPNHKKSVRKYQFWINHASYLKLILITCGCSWSLPTWQKRILIHKPLLSLIESYKCLLPQCTPLRGAGKNLVGRKDKHNLVKESHECEKSIQNFNEWNIQFIKSKSIIVKTIRNLKGLPLPEENQNTSGNEENHINEEFNHFKKDFPEELDNSKVFFCEVKIFKENILMLHKPHLIIQITKNK